MLTARDEIADLVAGLDAGADEYMTKPFSPQDVLARASALSRRAARRITPIPPVVGDDEFAQPEPR